MRGPPPFGYDRDLSGKLVRNAEAVTRIRIFILFSQVQRKQTVAEILNADGYSTRSGTSFSTQTISRYLNDPVVLGIPGKIEQIVEHDLWQKCQAILAEQISKGGARRTTRHLFAGLLYCSCGQKMYVPSSSKKYVCRDCSAKIIAQDLEALFVQQVNASRNDKAVSSLLDQWDQLSFESKRETVEAICERIEVDGDCVIIHFAEL